MNSGLVGLEPDRRIDAAGMPQRRPGRGRANPVVRFSGAADITPVISDDERL